MKTRLSKIICFFSGHNWNGGGGGHTSFGDYQYLDCGRCRKRFYSIKDDKRLGGFSNRRYYKLKQL